MSIAVLDSYRPSKRPSVVGSLAVDSLVGVVPAPARPRHLRAVPQARPTAGAARAAAPRASAWRITRRGRLAVTCTVALAIVLAVASAIGTLTSAGATSAVVVEPGMTLTQIAAEQMPGVPLSEAVTEIQLANHLSSSSIAAGQELVIPGR